jgi:aconitase A
VRLWPTRPLIRITITPAAYAAIAGSLSWGTVGVEPQRAENGDYFIWVAPGVVNKLRALRPPGESYSDVILRVAVEG